MKKLNSSLRVVLGLLLVATVVTTAKDPAGTKTENKSFAKTSGSPNATLLNINRISSWYESNGKQEQNPFTGNSGLSYPRGTDYVIFSAGLMWGGQSDDGIATGPRVSGQSYNSGTQPGALLGMRTGVSEDPSDAGVRIWRIRRDYATADLRQDAAEFNSKAISQVSDAEIAGVREQYRKDWEQWPWQKGAPFSDTGYWDASNNKVNANNGVLDWGEDANKNGILDPSEDLNANNVLDAESPGAADADQVIWYVANDVRAGESPWKTKPLGLEMQTTIWGYNRTDALGNILFKKFKLIYKGVAATPPTAKINQMYLTQWSDPDLGDAGDDFAGCDVDLSLGYVYNSQTLDASYRKFNIAPPAAGYDFLQGPIVPGAPTDVAVFDLKYRTGYKNLPMTSFIYFAAGGKYTDPGFTLNGSLQWYSMMQGLPPTPQPLPYPPAEIDPYTGLASSFWLNGDPVTQSGWVDGKGTGGKGWDGPGDRRILLTSGPFTMALGDTQELVSAVVAGLGSDRISSISVMKFYDKTAQAAYNNLFDLPKPPPAPKVSYVELDRGIVLEWERDESGRKATEESNAKGFKFEGYNVYQLPSATSPISNGKKLVTYDLITDPSTVSQEEFDEASGQVLVKPVQLGKNSGLTRYMFITQDVIKGGKPLVNGQPYYFAVTAYNYNPDPLLVTKSFESSANVIIVTPKQPNPGVVLPYNINDTLRTLTSTNAVGENDAAVGMVVFNPILQAGNTFEVWYGGATTLRNYTIVKTISGSTDHATVTATMTAAKQVPANNTLPNAKGTGTFTINDAKTQVNYNITYEGLTGVPTAAHIHIGAAGSNGGVVHPFTITGTTNAGTITGSWAIPDSLKDEFYAGNLYVNIHTAANPGGEIRGNIADGLFPRTALPPAVSPLPSITTYTDHRLPNEGVSFFVAPAPKGPKTALQGTANIVNTKSPDGIYSLVGPLSLLAGAKDTEENFEIRFVSGVNYAVTVPYTSPTPTPPISKMIQVPFAVFKDTVRVWPVVLNPSDEDIQWNASPTNGALNGKPLFDVIVGVVDVVDASNNNLTYYSPTNIVFPPTSNAIKGRLINGVNHVMKDIKFVSEKGDGTPPAVGTSIKFTANKSVKIGDVKSFTLKAYKENVKEAALAAVSKVNVFPNPYYAVNSSERRREARFVTINHLPKKATIHIFNLAGTLVTTLQKDDPSQFFEWNLTNHKGLPVASGIYLIHIDMGDLGTKILKSAIIMEQQFLDKY